MSSVRVFLIDDHPIVRAGARLAVNGMPGYEVCGEAGAPAGAADAAKAAGADIVVADLLLGDSGDGMILVSNLRTALPKGKILVFSMNSEEIFAERSLKAGADGYLMKGGDLSQLQDAIRHVYSGKRYLSPAMELAAQPSSAKKALSSLSEREMQVFLLLGAGKSTQQIAVELGISMKTASAHRENLKIKLGLESGPELVRYAVAYVVGQGRAN